MASDDLKWEDLVSPTMSPDEYLKKFGDKIEDNYKTYEPQLDILEKIRILITKENETLKIVVLGADWCPDCNINVPRMIKIVQLMKNIAVDFRILYGIKVNTLHRKRQIMWHRRRSPKEATEPKFNLKKIPTFYFFNESGNLLGIIVENPKIASTLEEDLLEILEKNL